MPITKVVTRSRGVWLSLRRVRALGADASLDASTQAATLGGALFVLGGIVVASTEWLPPAGVDRAALLALSVLAVVV